MKVRVGFVSNSSSSSFVMLGYELGKQETAPYVRANFPEYVRKFEEHIRTNCPDILEEEFSHCVDDRIYDAVCNDGLGNARVVTCGYSGEMWIGRILAESDTDYGTFAEKVVASVEDIEKWSDEIQKSLDRSDKPKIIIISVGT